jgi:tetratricopeptide (TPR) repeat protein
MDSTAEKKSRKRLGELIVEAGIVKAEELPKGLEYAQKATDADAEAVTRIKWLMEDQAMSVATALKALLLAKQRRCGVDEALSLLGWRFRRLPGQEYPPQLQGAQPQPQPSQPDSLPGAVFPGREFETIPIGEITREHLRPIQGASGNTSGPAAGADPTIPPAPQSFGNNPPPVPTPAAEMQDFLNVGREIEMEKSTGPQLSHEEELWQSMSAPKASSVIDQAAQVPKSTEDELWQMMTDTGAPQQDSASAPVQQQDAAANPFARPAQQDAPPNPFARPVEQAAPPNPAGQPASSGQASSNYPDPQLVSTARDTAGSAPYISILQSGDACFAQGQVDAAINYYKDALAYVSVSFGQSSPEEADLLVRMGRAYIAGRKLVESESCLCRALQIRELSLGKDDMPVAACLESLAELYEAQSQNLQAESYYLASLGIKERNLDPGDSQVTISLKKLATVAKRIGLRPEDRKAGEILVEAGIVGADALESALKQSKDKAVPIGRALITLDRLSDDDLRRVLQAQLLMKEGVLPSHIAMRALKIASQRGASFEDALSEIGITLDDPECQRAFELLSAVNELMRVEAEVGADKPELAALNLKLADLYVEHSKYNEAKPLYDRAISIIEKSAGENDLGLVEPLVRLAQLHARMQDVDAAESIYMRVLDICEQHNAMATTGYATALECLATLRYLSKDFKDAGRLYQLAIDAREKTDGANHPGMVAAMHGRANCFMSQLRTGEAEKLYRQAVAIQEKALGADHPQLAGLIERLGDLYAGKENYNTALAEYMRSMTLMTGSSSPNVLAFAALLSKIANCYAELGNLDKACAYYEHFFRTRDKSGSGEYVDIADLLDKYAVVLDKAHNASLAEEIRKRAEGIRASK